MIRAALYDVQQLNRALQKLQDHPDLIYRPWKEYLSLSVGQKRTIIIEQENFLKAHKLLTIHNINTNAALQVPMHSTEAGDTEMVETSAIILETKMELKTTTIVDFLTNHYKAGDGTNLFTYVYTPIAGKIEVVVTKAHWVEAKHCIETINSDLMYYCNIATREQVFDSIKIQETSLTTYIPWQPYTCTTMVEPTEAPEPTIYTTKRRKTQRATEDDSNGKHGSQTVPSYAAVAANNKRCNESITTTTTQTSELTTIAMEGTDATNTQTSFKEIKMYMKNQDTKMLALENLIKNQSNEVEAIIDKKIKISEAQQNSNIQGILNQQSDYLMEKFSALLHARDMQAKSWSTKSDNMHPRKRISKNNSETDSANSSNGTEEFEFE